MAFETGTVSLFHNKDIAGEVLGQGDGSTTTFNFTVSKPPIFLSPFTLNYTVGGSLFQATTDVSGNLSGTHISSGSVTEAGAVNVTFSTAPDNATDISADFRAKGLLQKIKDFVTTDQYAENGVATGDGATTNFSGTLSNGGTLSKGQVRVTFTINSFEYQVYDNGQGEWIHDEITSSSFDYSTKAWSFNFANPLDDGTPIDFFYGEGSPGQDWLVLLDENTKNNSTTSPADAFPGELLNQIVLKNSGNSFEESIIVGLRETKYVAGQFYTINFNAYRKYQDGDVWIESALGADGHGRDNYDATRQSFSILPRVSLNDDQMTYWLFSNKNRILISIRVIGTVYESAYLGQLLRFASSVKYPQPTIIIGSDSSNGSFNNTLGSHQFIAATESTERKQLLIEPDNKWENDLFFLPHDSFNTATGSYTTTTKGEVPIWPIFVLDTSKNWLMGQLEGVWLTPGDTMTTEDQITEGARTIYVFQNVFRTEYQDFLGMEDIA